MVDCFGLVLQIDERAAVFGFYIYKRDVVFGRHGVSYASDFDFQRVVVNPSQKRQMFFCACFDCVCNEFLHVFTATLHGNVMVDYFSDYVSAMIAFVKFGSHSCKFLM